MYSDMVSESDEALVMQVVKFYFPRWDKGEDVVEDEGSEEGTEAGSKHSGGAERGERLTCSRTTSSLYEYIRRFRAARNSPYSQKWDERLQAETIRDHREKQDDEETRQREENDDAVGTTFDADVMNGTWDGMFEEDVLPTTPVLV
jgi:hypothetical protein